MKNTVKNCYVLLSLILFLVASCSKKELIEYPNQLAPLPNKNEFLSYLNGSELSTPVSTPNIYIFIIDTLRSDYINGKDTPNIYKFLKKYSTPRKILSTSTATHHSLYGAFFSRNSYERKAMINSGWNLGAPALQIFKKNNYAIHPFAVYANYHCLNAQNPFNDVRTETSQIQLIFGVETVLMASCNDGAPNLNIGNTPRAEIDVNILDRFKANLPNLVSSPKQLFIIHLEGPHSTFSWTDEIIPYSPNIKDTYIPSTKVPIYKPSNPTEKEILALRNSYKNSVKSSDVRFGEFIEAIKDLGGNHYRDSIIVLFSDHGINLFENNNTIGHGGPAYHEVIHPILSIKFSGVEESNLGLFASINSVELASLQDIFPTIFDSMGMENYGQDYYLGQTLFGYSRKSFLVAPPRESDDNPWFALVNEQYKVFAKLIYNESMMSANGFQIDKITDLKDRPIPFEHHADLSRYKIETDFADTLGPMFQWNE